MKNFLFRLVIFIIPFPIYIGLVILIDPFNYYDVSDIISRESKLQTSGQIQPQLWKLIEYKRIKAPRIILGDSRAVNIFTNDIRELTGIDIYNFAYDGGTLTDIIETFWYAAGLQKPEEVYLGISFNLYNDFEKNNRVEQARSIMKNTFTYSFNKLILLSMIQNIKTELFSQEYQAGIPDMDKDEFWSYQLDVMAARFYNKYRHPDQYYSELVRISKYCTLNGIRLVFIIPPTHVDLQHKISEFKLEKENEVFIEEISGLGTLYNLDVENEYTRDKSNFVDPYHTVNDSLVIHTVWEKQIQQYQHQQAQ